MLQNLVAESVGKKRACGTLADATGTDVEQGLFVKLTDSGAMGTFDIIVVNLQEGLGVDESLVGEEDVLVGLVGFGFDGTFANKHMTIESTLCAIVKNALVEFVAFAVGESVVDENVVVDTLLLVVKVESVCLYLAVLAEHTHLSMVANVATIERDGYGTERRTLAKRDVCVVEQTCVVVKVLHLIIFHLGTFFHNDFGDIVRKSGMGVERVVAMDDDGMAVATNNDQVAHLEEETVAGIDDRLDLDGFNGYDIVWHIGKYAIGVVVGVELEIWISERGAGAEIFANKVGLLAAGIAQAGKQDTLGCGGAILMAETIFGKRTVGVEVGYVAAIFGCLALAGRKNQSGVEHIGEIDLAPHFVFAECVLNVAKLLYEFFHF